MTAQDIEQEYHVKNIDSRSCGICLFHMQATLQQLKEIIGKVWLILASMPFLRAALSTSLPILPNPEVTHRL